MARDRIGDRFEKRREKKKLTDISRKNLSDEQLDEEETLLADAKRHREADPEKYRLKAGSTVGRNDPCPCRSGKKYKKCCGSK